MSSTAETASEIRPFQVDIPEDDLADLRRRVAATRWPSKELVARSIAGRAVGDSAGAGPLLDERSTTGAGVRRD